MKKFEEAELEVMTFANNVIVTSGTCDDEDTCPPDYSHSGGCPDECEDFGCEEWN